MLTCFATGNTGLESADPTEKVSEALDLIMTKTKSRELKRFAELSEIMNEAFPEGLGEFALKIGPATFFQGVEKDLAEICIADR